MFIVSSIIWSMGGKKWVLKISCELFNLKPCKKICQTQMDYNNLKTMFALKAKNYQGSNIVVT
jgi:hypothetical protein